MLGFLTESLQPLDPPIDMAIAVGVAEDIAAAVFVVMFITVEAVKIATPTLSRPISIFFVLVVLLCINQNMLSSEGVGEVK